MPRSTSGSPSAAISQSNTATMPRGIERIQQDVVQLEVAVDDSRIERVRRLVRGEPEGDSVHRRQFIERDALPPLRPSAHLTIDESNGLPSSARWGADTSMLCRSARVSTIDSLSVCATRDAPTTAWARHRGR